MIGIEIVVSELFSMTAKSAATSAATGLLFLTGAVINLVFLSLEDAMGPYVFLLFAALSLAAAAFVALKLPETKGRTLAEVQALLA
ncbi:Solute carrier family 2, facilitated glucose transporter member 7, partial [Tetrabaena socialis]